MGCNCGKNKKTWAYLYTPPSGKKVTYTSEVQAKAAVIKNGGRYEKVPA